nr:hypothetical protein [Streptomyces luteoverticillatus]
MLLGPVTAAAYATSACPARASATAPSAVGATLSHSTASQSKP